VKQRFVDHLDPEAQEPVRSDLDELVRLYGHSGRRCWISCLSGSGAGETAEASPLPGVAAALKQDIAHCPGLAYEIDLDRVRR
jgi:hypothetical protein